jgi:hypothetical protein
MANRADVDAVDYLVRHGANVGALYAHWDYEVQTPPVRGR